jgi:hypothetical protein
MPIVPVFLIIALLLVVVSCFPNAPGWVLPLAVAIVIVLLLLGTFDIFGRR